jgi:lysyl-tRNA synthetase class II
LLHCVVLSHCLYFSRYQLSLFIDCYIHCFDHSGRIQNKRIQSKKLYFYDIINNGVRLQVMCSKQRYHSSKSSSHSQCEIQSSSDNKQEREDDFTFMNRILKRGDIIGKNQLCFADLIWFPLSLNILFD